VIMVSAALFTSNRTDWATPQPFYDRLNAEFAFTLDACASPQNAKCARYFTVEQDGLAQPWTGTVWVNPPYGKGVTGLWARKAWQESQGGAIVVMLIPSRTDTIYWHDYVMRAAEIRLVRGRIKFVLPDGVVGQRPTFPSAVVVFRPGIDGPPLLSSISANLHPTVGSSVPSAVTGGRSSDVPAGAWLEIKEVHPGRYYNYWRWRENGRLRSKYAGRATGAKQ